MGESTIQEEQGRPDQIALNFSKIHQEVGEGITIRGTQQEGRQHHHKKDQPVPPKRSGRREIKSGRREKQDNPKEGGKTTALVFAYDVHVYFFFN